LPRTGLAKTVAACQVPAGLTRGLPLDDYVAIASFVFFGIKAILDAVRAIRPGAEGSV